MAIATVGAHVTRALDFFSKSNIYLALGKTTPWNETDTPPEPEVDDAEIQEIIGFKKIETIYMVVEDNVNGTILYKDSKWRVVPPDQALAEKAVCVYIDTSIRYDELPLEGYRQVGVYSGLTPFPGTKEQILVKITEECLYSGNISLVLDGITINIAVLAGDTVQTVATKIVNTAITGWTSVINPDGDGAIITSTTAGERVTPVFNPNSTGVTADISRLTIGQNPTPPQKMNLLPEEVSYNGVLQVIDNRELSTRQIDQKERLSMVLQF